MRFLLAILLALSVTQVGVAQADYLRGRVVSVDRERGEIAVAPCAEGSCRRMESKEDSPSQEELQTIIIRASWFPRCIDVGAEIYARGEFVDNHDDLFAAVDVFPCRGRGGHDPTGVRSRFHRHRRMMMHHKGGEMHD